MIRAILTSGSMRSLRHKPDRSCATKPGHTACHRHRAARHLDYGVARLLDLRVGDRVAADVFLAVPNEGSHAFLLSTNEDAEASASGTRYGGRSLRGWLSGLVALERLR